MLFGMATKSFTNYFLEQSGGTYLVSGEVSPLWVQVPHSEAYYGADQEYGDDNLNGPVWRVVQDAVAAAGNQVDWAKYDADGDGYVDHLMIIHAGAGQEAGGGAQGDSSIWSHSWFVNAGSGGPSGLGGAQTSDPNVWVGPYTIEPEDGTVGVFTHEFTHDLGAPDLYDTNYTGEASTGFWTLMASGSWLGDAGEPLGVSPSAEDAWTKYFLGWADPVVVKAGDPKAELELKQTSAAGTAGKVVKVELPDYQYQINLAAPKSGTKMWWSGHGRRPEQLAHQDGLPAERHAAPEVRDVVRHRGGLRLRLRRGEGPGDRSVEVAAGQPHEPRGHRLSASPARRARSGRLLTTTSPRTPARPSSCASATSPTVASLRRAGRSMTCRSAARRSTTPRPTTAAGSQTRRPAAGSAPATRSRRPRLASTSPSGVSRSASIPR